MYPDAQIAEGTLRTVLNLFEICHSAGPPGPGSLAGPSRWHHVQVCSVTLHCTTLQCLLAVHKFAASAAPGPSSLCHESSAGGSGPSQTGPTARPHVSLSCRRRRWSWCPALSTAVLGLHPSHTCARVENPAFRHPGPDRASLSS